MFQLSWLNKLSDIFMLFTPAGCKHANVSRPRQSRQGGGFVVCLDCATELPYEGDVVLSKKELKRYSRKVNRAKAALAQHDLPNEIALAVGIKKPLPAPTVSLLEPPWYPSLTTQAESRLRRAK